LILRRYEIWVVVRSISEWINIPILYSAAVVRKRTIPTERPQLVGEFSANLCG
jgi:hypothetical protein